MFLQIDLFNLKQLPIGILILCPWYGMVHALDFPNSKKWTTFICQIHFFGYFLCYFLIGNGVLSIKRRNMTFPYYLLGLLSSDRQVFLKAFMGSLKYLAWRRPLKNQVEIVGVCGLGACTKGTSWYGLRKQKEDSRLLPSTALAKNCLI